MNSAQPVVALTFDDGPNSRYTPQVLDILYEEQVPATFFLVGEKFAGNELLIKEMAASGHEIGSHTFSHPDLTTLNTQQIRQEIRQTEKELKKILPDYPVQYVRPPYGRYTEKVEKAIDLPLMLWTIDSGDWENPDAEKIYTTVVRNIQDGDIVVFHDDNAETVKALEKIIVELKARGFQFVAVSQMYEMIL
jgi:peptidoglycan/xylan/chitin deacetylase (PgdA/CDA1 family)